MKRPPQQQARHRPQQQPAAPGTLFGADMWTFNNQLADPLLQVVVVVVVTLEMTTC
jgi:hypothetical protein